MVPTGTGVASVVNSNQTSSSEAPENPLQGSGKADKVAFKVVPLTEFPEVLELAMFIAPEQALFTGVPGSAAVVKVFELQTAGLFTAPIAGSTYHE